jgi:ABC-2 type transport system ATP-binding protein
MKSIIELKNVNKTYSDGTIALKDLSLTINKGEFFGLLGPNGAGKSTTIGILTSLVNKTSGDITIAGYDIDVNPALSKLELGIVPQEFNFNIFETCTQILVQQAGYYGIHQDEALPRAKKLLKSLGLETKLDTQSRMLSGGMKRRLMIARALMHNPKVLLLDEPTAGVDVKLRKEMWEFLTKENKKGLTIVLTTHNLQEAEELCKRIGIIDHGKLIALGETETLLEQLQSETFIFHTTKKLNKDQIKVGNKVLTKITSKSLEVEINENQSVSDIIDELSDKKIRVHRITSRSNRLEELFLKLTKRNQDEMEKL